MASWSEQGEEDAREYEDISDAYAADGYRQGVPNGPEYEVDEVEVTVSEPSPTGDAAVGAAISRAGSNAAGAARGAGKSIAGGFSAMRQVRQASKLRANAQSDLRDIELGLEEDRSLLVHREDVERNYEEIVLTQTGEIDAAQAEVNEAAQGLEEQQAEKKRLEDELRRMRERHEQKLRPYRNLMDSSRGRSDDAAKALANARRAVKSAESAVNDATKRRSQRISAAHRAVDNAKERLSAVQAEYDALMADGATDSSAVAKVEGELQAEAANLQTKHAEVTQVTEEAQSSVDQAQQNLWALQRELSAAEKVAETAKEEATTHKDEYDGLFKEAQAKERAHEEAIKSCDSRIRDLSKTKANAETRVSEAQAVLDEANEIHAHPETTEGLRQRIANEEDDLMEARAELEELTISERELRRSTRGARTIFIVVTVLVVLLIAVLVWFFLLRA